jgi:hypothetical protein
MICYDIMRGLVFGIFHCLKHRKVDSTFAVLRLAHLLAVLFEVMEVFSWSWSFGGCGRRCLIVMGFSFSPHHPSKAPHLIPPHQYEDLNGPHDVSRWEC